MYIFNPFEQFITVPLISIQTLNLDFTISNVSLCLFLIFLTVVYTIYLISDLKNFSLYAIPTSLESHIFLSYIAIQSILEKHVHVKFYQQVMFPITFALGIFLLLLNLSGNLPLFMSLTSQFAVISAFCLPTFFGIFIWFVLDRQVTFLRTFYAPGTEIPLAIVLFPVELLTYFMRPISIICRLCANIMSGHVIVKVCLHTIFALTQIKSSYNFFFSILITILILQLVPLLILEVCVSLIQVYVFLVIFCMFLSDTFGHHYRY
jgi:F-type H+-transporting ATPase subunit a